MMGLDLRGSAGTVRGLGRATTYINRLRAATRSDD